MVGLGSSLALESQKVNFTFLFPTHFFLAFLLFVFLCFNFLSVLPAYLSAYSPCNLLEPVHLHQVRIWLFVWWLDGHYTNIPPTGWPLEFQLRNKEDEENEEEEDEVEWLSYWDTEDCESQRTPSTPRTMGTSWGGEVLAHTCTHTLRGQVLQFWLPELPYIKLLFGSPHCCFDAFIFP